MHKTNELKGFFPDQTFTTRDVIPDAILLQAATVAGEIHGDVPVIRVPYVSEDPDVGFVAEGEKIATSNGQLSETIINARKIAVIVKASREAAEGSLETYLANSMRRAMTVKANVALFSNEANPTGLLNTAGITDGGTLSDNLDALTDAMTEVESKGAVISHIICDPKSWGHLQKLKTGTGSASLLLGSPAEQTERRLFGVPVLVSAQVPQGTIIINDRENLVAAWSEIELAKSADAYFEEDSYGYRATLSMGWALVRPERLAKLTVEL